MPVGSPTLPQVSPWLCSNPNVAWAEKLVREVRDSMMDNGWYFFDETYDMYGPFGTREEAIAACATYAAMYL